MAIKSKGNCMSRVGASCLVYESADLGLNLATRHPRVTLLPESNATCFSRDVLTQRKLSCRRVAVLEIQTMTDMGGSPSGECRPAP